MPIRLEKMGNPIKLATYKGVSIESRYDQPAEILKMKQVIDRLPPMFTFYVKRIFCDSKAGNCYTIKLNTNIDRLAERFSCMADILFKEQGGHNGIYVEYEGGSFIKDPNWNEEPDDEHDPA